LANTVYNNTNTVYECPAEQRQLLHHQKDKTTCSIKLPVDNIVDYNSLVLIDDTRTRAFEYQRSGLENGVIKFYGCPRLCETTQSKKYLFGEKIFLIILTSNINLYLSDLFQYLQFFLARTTAHGASDIIFKLKITQNTKHITIITRLLKEIMGKFNI